MTIVPCVHRSELRANGVDVPEIAKREHTRLVRVDAARDELLRAHLDMEADLVVGLAQRPAHRTEHAPQRAEGPRQHEATPAVKSATRAPRIAASSPSRR